MTRIVQGPFNRVEGDLEISLEATDGKIAAAWVNSPLFRGFEQILLGRPAADALVIVPRICGICSVAQSSAAAAALAAASGVTATDNGLRMQQLILATENLSDLVSHFYLLFMPDFAHAAYAGVPEAAGLAERFAAVRGTASREFLPARAGFLRLMGQLAGKWPHNLAIVPGGSTRSLTDGERIRVLAILREFRHFLEQQLFADRLEAVSTLTTGDDLRAWAASHRGDAAAFLRLGFALGLHETGRASEHFLSFGAYGCLPSGLRGPSGQVVPLDIEAIREDVSHAWLAGAEPLPPASGQTIVDADRAAGYSWCKAPRYAGQAVEVGALARQLLAGQPLLVDLVRQHGASVLARVTARLIEVAQVIPQMETWARQLQPGQPFCAHAALPEEAEGIGLVEAARGSLGHWLSIRRGRIERYQIIAPTTWNFSPRDSGGQPGPLEQALVGLPTGPEAPPTLQHVVRSFDPCMACTVH